MITISLQAGIYDAIIQGMVSDNPPWSVPAGTFYGLNGDVCAYSPNPTVFLISTDLVGQALGIQIQSSTPSQLGVDPRNNPRTLTVVAQSSVITVSLQLSPGRNTITVSALNDPGDSAQVIVTANPIVTAFEAFARVLYSVSTQVIDELKQAISSDLATRLLEPFISFPNLLPDTQSLQILATRLCTRGLIHNVGLSSGITDLLKALTLCTPVYRPCDKDTFNIDPILDPWPRTSSQFAGKEAHIWLPNLEVANWLAFMRYCSAQPDVFEIVSIREDQIAIKYQGELQRHLYNPAIFGTSFLTEQSQQQCFKSITVYVTQKTNSTIEICAASYTFDLYIDADHPIGIGRPHFDSGVAFDQGLTFDSDPVDPLTDGWLGLSLSGRFEQDEPITSHQLDSFVQASTSYAGSLCAYPSYHMVLATNERYDLDGIPQVVTVTAIEEQGNAFVIQDVNSVNWEVYVNPNGSLYAVSGSSLPPSHWVVTKPDSTQAGFAITTGGQIQVVTPPGPNDVNLNDSLFLLCAETAKIWKLTVNQNNQMVTELVF